jgi:hypothetical protein
MPECPHPDFESLVTVSVVTPTGLPPGHQVRLQVRCTQCQGRLTFSGLPPVLPVSGQTVALGAGGTEVYLTGTVIPPSPPQEGQAWTRVVMPTAPPAEASASSQA